MAKDLVIVESPTKARTIAGILGNRYVVRASVGHVRDLPTTRLGVELNGGFQPEYIVPEGKRAVIAELKALAREASVVYLATDPDREGEAISWHLAQAVGLEPSRLRRVVSHEITPEGVRAAFRAPREIDMDLVNAQQARRVLDRLVGYKLSPLVAKKLRYWGLSAGRVQSVALRLVVEREREIAAFVPQESWSIEAQLAKASGPGAGAAFTAELHSRRGHKQRLNIANQDQAQGLVRELEGAAYAVEAVTQRPVRQEPRPPFITSTLQQEAGRKLGFTATRTMQVAQQLFEGVVLGRGGSVGLITYMRTDSTHVAASALREAREYISKAFGTEYVPPKARVYRKRVKGAQEAHEAIRPTSALQQPARIRDHLTPQQYRLYDLIWKRFLSSQMADAVGTSTRVEIAAGGPRSGETYLFRATGTVMTFLGFRRLYQEGADDPGQDGAEAPLPPLAQGDLLRCLGLEPRQHFTQPPPRYTEPSLIRDLEEDGIGRPSTYATIVSTIQARGYVQRKRGRLHSLPLGFAVSDLLTAHFPQVVDLGFTAQMEEELDEVARGQRDWQAVLREFYDPFAEEVKRGEQEIPRTGVIVGDPCELCGRPMILKRNRWGGSFVSCSGFPECRHARSLQVRTGITCPRCKKGELVERRARTGKRRTAFYGCSSYPECDFTVDQKPQPEPCPECGGLLVQQGRTKVRCTACAYQGAAPERETVPAEA
jgi:DNA topoisomerase-1